MAMSSEWGRATGIAHVMRVEAAAENKANHVRHVEHQIEYTNAACEATKKELMEWVKELLAKELPGMIQKELSKPSGQVKVQAKVDEKSLSDCKKKITDMLKSIFH